MSEVSPFLARVLERAPKGTVSDFVFKSWEMPGKATSETVGFLPVPGVDAEKLFTCVMDVNRYKSFIPHVVDSRIIADPRFVPPTDVRFYQRVKIPLLGDVHQDAVLSRIAEQNGFQIVSWRMLDKETEALGGKDAIRLQYSDGAWLVGPGVVGYALSSAPRREDVGFLKWKALTAGADVAASKVVKDNIAAMGKWAKTVA